MPLGIGRWGDGVCVLQLNCRVCVYQRDVYDIALSIGCVVLIELDVSVRIGFVLVVGHGGHRCEISISSATMSSGGWRWSGSTMIRCWFSV